MGSTLGRAAWLAWAGRFDRPGSLVDIGSGDPITVEPRADPFDVAPLDAATRRLAATLTTAIPSRPAI